jgi:hypothetical protein
MSPGLPGNPVIVLPFRMAPFCGKLQGTSVPSGLRGNPRPCYGRVTRSAVGMTNSRNPANLRLYGAGDICRRRGDPEARGSVVDGRH